MIREHPHPQGKSPGPHTWSFTGIKKQMFPSLPIPTPNSSLPPSTSHPTSHPLKSEASENMASYSARCNSEEQKRGKSCNHPVRLIEGISEALGVRHSSSSFLHRCLYKQVSNAPDVVWQTFSKEHLKQGWGSDTPTWAFFFRHLQNHVSAFSFFSITATSVSLLFFSQCLSLMSLWLPLFALTGLLWSLQLHKKCG